MEQSVNFDEIINNLLTAPIEYCAEFNVETGKVTRLGASSAFVKENKNVISVDNEIAEQVLSGKIPLSRCFVDPMNAKLELVETKNIRKIDDVLHRITDLKWTDIDKPDLYVVYKNKCIIIELSEELGGTYKLPQKYQPVKPKKIFWEGDTGMKFLITDYNDPHIIHDVLNLKLQDLYNGPVKFKKVEYSKQNSLYTKRLFENYVMEIKRKF